jgi:uncharacterized RDD family membrane protein YckC
LSEARRDSILGLDNIRLDLPVAGLGSRSLAVLLDYLVLAVVIVAWVFVGGLALAAVSPDLAAVFMVSGLFLLQWGYFAIQEIATRGRTLGKRALGLRVVTAEGGTPGPGALLIRNLVKSLDIIFGVPLMAIDPLSRRLGDRLAGTLVVHERAREEAASPLFGRVPPGWSARELVAVESFLSRARSLEDVAAVYEMADRILQRIRRDAPDLLAGVDTRTDPVAAIRQALRVEEG